MKKLVIIIISLILIGAVICLISVIGVEGLGFLCFAAVLGVIEAVAGIFRTLVNLLIRAKRK